jgi:hypothetical protein
VRFVKGFGRFWYDFLIGDDWKIAAAVVTVLTVGAIAVAVGSFDSHVLAAVLAISVAAAFTAVVLVDARSSKR